MPLIPETKRFAHPFFKYPKFDVEASWWNNRRKLLPMGPSVVDSLLATTRSSALSNGLQDLKKREIAGNLKQALIVTALRERRKSMGQNFVFDR